MVGARVLGSRAAAAGARCCVGWAVARAAAASVEALEAARKAEASVALRD